MQVYMPQRKMDIFCEPFSLSQACLSLVDLQVYFILQFTFSQ